MGPFAIFSFLLTWVFVLTFCLYKQTHSVYCDFKTLNLWWNHIKKTSFCTEMNLYSRMMIIYSKKYNRQIQGLADLCITINPTSFGVHLTRRFLNIWLSLIIGQHGFKIPFDRHMLLEKTQSPPKLVEDIISPRILVEQHFHLVR